MSSCQPQLDAGQAPRPCAKWRSRTRTKPSLAKLTLYMAALACCLYALPIAAQITDPARWLVQALCADGSPPNHCDFPAPQRISDPVYYSRHDWPPPIGYSFSHSTLGTDATFVQNFRFADGGLAGRRYILMVISYSRIKRKTPARPILITLPDPTAAAPAGSCLMSMSRRPGGPKGWRCSATAMTGQSCGRTIRPGRGSAATISLLFF